MPIKNFLDSYLEYCKGPDVPLLYHRWCGVLALGVSIAKRAWFIRGPYQVCPNLYVMLMGEPGTGKGTACYYVQTVLQESGYEKFAADRSSKEKFLQDMADGMSYKEHNLDAALADTKIEGKQGYSLFGDTPGDFSDVFILAEEFNDFIGQNNADFVAWLTKMWSYEGTYRYRLKTGRSVSIPSPCLSILGGNTSQGFAAAFPPDISNQGFLARFILVSGDSSGSKTSFPTPPDPILKGELANFLELIRNTIAGEISAEPGVMDYLDELNQTWSGLEDPRFKDYGVRRFTQLIKVAICHTAARVAKTMSKEDVDKAHQLLKDTEHWMPKALGAFGKSRHSDVSNKILQVLHNTDRPLNMMEIWRVVVDDLDKLEDLTNILAKLKHAERVQVVKVADKVGYLPKHPAVRENVIQIKSKGEKSG